ncbi:uncharacterized protein PHALS_11954 [Plasmopara halstedii]|uniref:Uncharacterized protein n=1 Tax=Plasmopara halstedii TaxID=4781 RepID=A0A0P1AKZ7_PLAHL|nr:uncharacterized protein PHALS_11954 [Plasmopara halstedii]CEG41621.1 hypothetical protein PHALS_11954 [Plasmopara halstedii]|eukprot:XP_024577990.1 hypothetical protein PHALS_11954 [Plasmopara halstedii]
MVLVMCEASLESEFDVLVSSIEDISISADDSLSLEDSMTVSSEFAEDTIGSSISLDVMFMLVFVSLGDMVFDGLVSLGVVLSAGFAEGVKFEASAGFAEGDKPEAFVGFAEVGVAIAESSEVVVGVLDIILELLEVELVVV